MSGTCPTRLLLRNCMMCLVDLDPLGRSGRVRMPIRRVPRL
ncbi:UNVERIFIED_CONTAM: hypothetical protein GTU68_045854 [Idotea baltica]|nr:hypothetical protein [Idotea baltica]